ncbi:MAG TPA: efflux transporter periplasmic adaptor subunit, partial [Flavobacteriaceae bacterium]|nr:efflux transporter periplasmic adaptor subunit [Flavobacteriaceae bacterium]
MNDGKLSIRKVDIILTDSKYAYIRSGIEDNEQVVITNLSTVAEG